MARRASRRPRVLPDDACHECGTMMRERRATLKLPVNGEVVSVPAVPHLACPKCHEVVLRFDDAGRLVQGRSQSIVVNTDCYSPRRFGRSVSDWDSHKAISRGC